MWHCHAATRFPTIALHHNPKDLRPTMLSDALRAVEGSNRMSTTTTTATTTASSNNDNKEANH
jgi:hypothetical protein